MARGPYRRAVWVGQGYDTIALSGARTALVVGAVAGSGIPTATLMGQLRIVIKSLCAFGLQPDELLARLHATVASLAAERAGLPPLDPLHPQALAATCAYAVHDPLNRTLTVAGAGSPALPDGSARVRELSSGSPLGRPERTPFAASRFDVPDESLPPRTSPPGSCRHWGVRYSDHGKAVRTEQAPPAALPPRTDPD